MKIYHYKNLFDELYSIFPKDRVIALKFEDIFSQSDKSLGTVFGREMLNEPVIENKTTGSTEYKVTKSGNRVDIPSKNVTDEVMGILKHSHWESFIPELPEYFATPQPISKVSDISNFANINLAINNENFGSADILREVALAFEKDGDIETAYSLMKKASALRPNGPFIKKKVEEYREILSY